MEIIHIATGHAFEMLGSIAIIGSLLFTAFELRHVEKAQRVSNLLNITRQHREIWSKFYDQPQLKRVLNPKVDLKQEPITDQESLFVNFLILHLNASFKATRAKMLVTAESLREDIRSVFNLPIPRAVWEKAKAFQDQDFAEFVESCLKDHRC